jgi:drug/metabolite transporter (DMT)-like permease
MSQPSPTSQSAAHLKAPGGPHEESTPLGMALVFGGWMLWSLDPIVIALIGPEVSRSLIVGVNLTLGGLVLSRHVGRLVRGLKGLSRTVRVRLVLQGVVFTGCASLFYVSAVRHMHPGLVSTVLRTQVAFAVIGAVALLGERMNRTAVAGMAVIFLGNGMMVVRAARSAGLEDQSVLGWSLAMGAALLMTGGTLNGKVLLRTVAPTQLTGVRLLLGGLVMAGATLAMRGAAPFVELTSRQWFWLGVKGLGTTTIGFIVYYHGLKRVRVYVASAIETAAPLLTIVAAWVLLDNPLRRRDLVSVAVLLTGTALVVIGSIRARRRGLPPRAKQIDNRMTDANDTA